MMVCAVKKSLLRNVLFFGREARESACGEVVRVKEECGGRVQERRVSVLSNSARDTGVFRLMVVTPFSTPNSVALFVPVRR